jgi:lysozyme family protein
LRWGTPIANGRYGAIAVLSRGADPAAGHVGFLLGETDTEIALLGGNQSDAVTVVTYPKARLLGFRWPDEVGSSDAGQRSELFERALAHVLEMEGGYTDDPYDPGGPTNCGITLKTFAVWKGIEITSPTRESLKAELKHVPEAAVRDIYAARYWQLARCDDLPLALAVFHFDAAVNHGVTGAARLLQQAAGTDVDGEIGPLTLAAVARSAIEVVLDDYAEVRRHRYRSLPHFWRFGRGWLVRVDKTLKLARDVAKATDAQASFSPSQQKGPSNMTDSSKPASKWWGESMTIWGALITGLSTVLPALGPIVGFDITGDLVREAGEQIVQTVQAFGGLLGTILTIYGRLRASQPLEQRSMMIKL